MSNIFKTTLLLTAMTLLLMLAGRAFGGQSGMLMALESGEVAAQAIVPELGRLRNGESFESIAREYRAQYARRFDSRMHVSGLLRRAAFVPRLAEAAIILFSANKRLRRRLARATRKGTR